MLSELKQHNLSAVMETQSKSAKEGEIGVLKKTISNLESFVKEQKKGM